MGGLLALGTLALAPLQAFPPAPFHTLYGTVRDEHGQVLRVEGSVVVVYRDDVEVLRQTIAESETRPDQNYQLRLRMDMQRAGTRTYSSLAAAPGATFSLAILIHDVPYYPIEVSGPVQRALGKPGERVRLDLTLGADGDGDGIPDAWEMSQLYAGGVLPGENGWDLSLISRDGDFDGDGLSNHSEYIAGTFATDPTDFLSLQITARFPGSVRLRFFGILGKTYSLEKSTDLQTWTEVPAYLSNPTDPGEIVAQPALDSDRYDAGALPAPVTTLRASATDFLTLYAPVGADTPNFFFRLKVR